MYVCVCKYQIVNLYIGGAHTNSLGLEPLSVCSSQQRQTERLLFGYSTTTTTTSNFLHIRYVRECCCCACVCVCCVSVREIEKHRVSSKLEHAIQLFSDDIEQIEQRASKQMSERATRAYIYTHSLVIDELSYWRYFSLYEDDVTIS